MWARVKALGAHVQHMQGSTGTSQQVSLLSSNSFHIGVLNNCLQSDAAQG